ncbi:acyl-CoA dehydrogenase family protein [Mycobacterium sp. CVI_P3]|uniref:Acyl-CoA dehydrogenase family protein n=1 Tax=Mycobacterium pinniadriaticum TaxID=2994102 RepID=A0ABT3SL02_9MYCO|nr:acyl-CoA dehydrogenase family protein [Mycobacterium pinniadriaticum]MCX2940187.1 acyl-CoA dehydrogenase family protein [Mycobacterium pinniadriaticum]
MTTELELDQRPLRDAARKFLDHYASSAQVHQIACSTPSLDRTYWSAAAELGWTSLLVPENAGGGSISGRPFADVAVLAEEAGRHVAPGPLVPCNVVAWVLSRDDAEPTGDALSSVLDGSAVAAWSLVEPGSGWDPDAVAVRATRAPGGHTVTGIKTVVEAAPDADVFLVSARDEDGVGLYLVDRSAPGVAVTPKRGLDPTRGFGTVEFATAPATKVAGGDAGRRISESAYCAAIAIQTAETASLMRHVFEITLDWVTKRYAFGRVVGSYQAIKHRLAEHYLALEVATGAAAGLATALDEGSPEASALASAAKAYIGDAAVALVQDAIQLHGGIGMTWEHDLHLYLRRASTNRVVYGDPAAHRERLCRLAGV